MGIRSRKVSRKSGNCLRESRSLARKALFELLPWIGRVSWRFSALVRQLIVKNHAEQGPVNLDSPVVFDKPKLTEPVHEEAYP